MARHSTGTPATTALSRAGVAFIVHTYEHDPAAPSYGLEAAAALDVPADRIFKTLLVEEPGGALAVGIVPVEGSLDLKAMARALGCKRVGMADPSSAERVTGYLRGGISPLGQRRRLPTVLDESAYGHQTVLVSGGRRGLDVELAPADLARLTGAVRASIQRPSS